MSEKISAKVTGVRISPRKVGEVVSLIRGRTVADALVILQHTPRRAAKPVEKLIKSVQSNADSKGLLVDSLDISQISVGPGFTMKRFRPAARGRALPYRKRTSNISVEIEGALKPKKKTSSTAKPVAKVERKKTTSQSRKDKK